MEWKNNLLMNWRNQESWRRVAKSSSGARRTLKKITVKKRKLIQISKHLSLSFSDIRAENFVDIHEIIIYLYL